MKKFKITKGNRVYIVDAKSHIDAINKVKAVETDEVRDSISQWKPGMSEIGLFQISYKKGTVYQSILVKAATKEDAINKFTKHKPDAEVIGVNEYPNPHFGEPILDSSIKDINQVLLSNLKQVAQKGDAWWNKWKKLLDTSDKWNSYQWKELRNNDPKKYELIIRNKEYAEKEAEALNREWDRAIDALSRDRSFGKPGDYRMDLHSYKSRNDNYPMGNSQRYDEILYGYEQAEKSAREKKGLDSSIKDAYIEEWWGQTSENPNTVARRYGVSVKQLKRNNDQILYRFEGDIDKLNRMHSDGYFMSIDMDGNSIKDSVIKDDRLSPMTYKKLKELGYDKNKWQNLTQEQANKIVQSNVTSSSNSGNKSTSFEKTRYDQPKTARTNNKQIIENNEQKTHKLSDISNEVVKDIKRFISKESTKDPRAIVRYIRNTAIIAAEKNKTNVCEGSGGEKYKFNVTDGSNYSQAFKMALGGVPVTVNGRIARVKFVTPDEYLAQSAKQKGISTSELLTNTDDEAYQNVLSGLKKDKTLSSGIYMDYNNKSQEGNRRVRALKELGVTSIPVLYVGRKWDKENDSALLHY